MTDPAIEFIREPDPAPGVERYSVAPDSQQALDDHIDAALAKAGLPSLEELREEPS